jgi:hypothetical protein
VRNCLGRLSSAFLRDAQPSAEHERCSRNPGSGFLTFDRDRSGEHVEWTSPACSFCTFFEHSACERSGALSSLVMSSSSIRRAIQQHIQHQANIDHPFQLLQLLSASDTAAESTESLTSFQQSCFNVNLGGAFTAS